MQVYLKSELLSESRLDVGTGTEQGLKWSQDGNEPFAPFLIMLDSWLIGAVHRAHCITSSRSRCNLRKAVQSSARVAVRWQAENRIDSCCTRRLHQKVMVCSWLPQCQQDGWQTHGGVTMYCEEQQSLEQPQEPCWPQPSFSNGPSGCSSWQWPCLVSHYVGVVCSRI